MSGLATRAEIEQHIQTLNVAWQYYGDVEDGRLFAYAPNETRQLQMDRARADLKHECAWLEAHGVKEDDLVYDLESRSYSLPADWRSERARKHIALLTEGYVLLGQLLLVCQDKPEDVRVLEQLQMWIGDELREYGADNDEVAQS